MTADPETLLFAPATWSAAEGRLTVAAERLQGAIKAMNARSNDQGGDGAEESESEAVERLETAAVLHWWALRQARHLACADVADIDPDTAPIYKV